MPRVMDLPARLLILLTPFDSETGYQNLKGHMVKLGDAGTKKKIGDAVEYQSGQHRQMTDQEMIGDLKAKEFVNALQLSKLKYSENLKDNLIKQALSSLEKTEKLVQNILKLKNNANGITNLLIFINKNYSAAEAVRIEDRIFDILAKEVFVWD